MEHRTHANDGIAVIGIGLRLPGQIHDLEDLWSSLARGAESVGPIPADRWVVEDYFDSDRSRSGRAYVRSGSFLDRIDGFDAGFFNVSPREAKAMDPQHRLMLEVAWEALEHAGIVPASLTGSRTGVFVGIGTSDYDFLREGVGEARTYLGTQPSFAAGRLAFLLGLRGPTMSVDTGCSSSLVSLHLARRALLNGECDIALSGAVQLMAAPDHYVQLAKIGALSPDGRSKTFSALADGFGRGEGVVVLVLERLSIARAKSRDILAIIRGSAINHNGIDPTGITAPNEQAQRELLRLALDDAGLKPEAIDYIECHGTGTQIGDPIEVRAISSVHAERPVEQPVRIGSIKTNVGHLEVAAGMAGVAKVLASFAHQALPPTIHTHPRNPAIDWACSRVEVVDQIVAWPRVDGRVRRAGVSAFGLSGTNAHAIFEEGPGAQPRRVATSAAPSRLPLLLSGRTPNDLAVQSARLAAWLRRANCMDVLDLSHSLATSRTHFACRKAVMVERGWGPQQLAAAIEAMDDQSSAPAVGGTESLDFAVARHLDGEHVDWEELFRPWAPRRVQLPTYAFARERHWIKEAPTTVTLALSGVTEPQLRARAEQMRARLVEQPHTSLVDLSAALARVEHAKRRAAIVTRSRDVARAALAAIAAGESHPHVVVGAADRAGKLVFAFPGQGAQWPEMARELLARSPTFAEAIEACERAFAPHVDWSLTSVLREPSAEMFERVDVIQPVLFAMMVSLARVWAEIGVRPEAVFGQSQGEIAAAHVAGALSLDDAAKVVCLRSRAIRALVGKGAMAAVVLPRERLAPYLEPFGDRLALAGDNGPSTVVCGEPQAIEALIDRLALDDVFARRINVNYASHTAQVEAIRDELLAALVDIEPRTAEIPMYSTVDARWLDGAELDGEYWYRNLRQVIRLADAVEGLLEAEHRYFVEVSPHPVMSVSLEVLFDRLGVRAVAVPTLRRDKGGVEQVQLSLAQLWAHGFGHDLAAQFEALGARPIELPAAPAADESGAGLCYRVAWTELRRAVGSGSGPCVVAVSSAVDVELPEGREVVLLRIDDEVTPEQLDAALERVGDATIVSLLALDERPHPLYPALPLGLTLNLVLGQAIGRRLGGRLWFATRGAVSIGAGDVLTSPSQAMSSGLGRSLSLADPQHWGGSIDMGGEWGEQGRVDARAVAELLDLVLPAIDASEGEDELAWRSGRMFARRLVHAPIESRGDVELPKLRGAVLITGGTGALGGHFARWLARAGAQELILVSRTGPAAAGMAELTAALEQLGAQVRIERCDTAEREAVARLFERLRGEGIELRGIVHAAGVSGPNLPLAELSVGHLAEVASGKAGGARWLHELSSEHGFELDAFVVLSSIWAVWGNPHVSAYSMANSYLDALVEHRRGRGLRATTTAWGVWDGEGLGNVEQRLDRIGFRRLDPEVAMAAFERIFVRGEREMMVVDIDWARFAEFYGAQGRRLLAEIAEARPQPTRQPVETKQVSAQSLLELVVQRTAVVLGMSAAVLDPDRGFTSMGLDSIMAVELRGELERATGLTLPATFVFEHPCAREAAAYLGERLGLSDVGPAVVESTRAMQSEEPIAIVGVGLRMPGGATDLDALFRLLEREVDAVGPVPIERWDADAVYDPNPDAPGKTYAREAAFIDGVDLFDAGFFNISPREAERIDPQHRLLLEASWEALERADVVPASLRSSATGVFIGIGQSDYEFLQQRSGLLDPYTTMGTHGSFAAGRVAFCLGLQGPAMSVDTACSSSLVALHLACRSLRAGECSLALAGGVQVLAAPDYGIQLARTRALAPDGRSKTFSATADGFGRGEGVVVVALERLSDARRNGRRILAVVRGSAVNHDGASSGITTPSGGAQQKVIRAALDDANLSPLEVDVVECHGTGTQLGDPIEVRALDAVYGEGRPRDRALLIGSIKTNVGHLESGSGLAGVAKMLAAFVHEAIPATIHTHPRNPHLDWEQLGVEVVDALRPWPRREGQPRRAGVSSFGLSGTNAHAILEEAPASREGASVGELPVIAPLVLSGRSAQAVREQVRRLQAWMRERPSLRRGDVAYSLATARTHFEQRAFVVGELLDGEIEELCAVVRSPRLAMMFSGQGSQRVGMGAALHAELPSFRAVFDEVCRRFDGVLEVSLREVMFGSADLLDRTAYTQPALFALELALARTLEALGVRPQIVLGHSIGEFVAAHLAGVFDLDDACRLVAARARLMDALAPGGAMISIEASEQEVAAALAGEVDIAGINGPMSTVISGDEDAALAIAASFAARGRRTKRLAVSHAFHSRRMNPMLDAFAEVALAIRYREPEIPVVSCVTGNEASEGELSRADYWVEQVRRCVRFADGADALARWGATAMLEIGPQAVLAPMVEVHPGTAVVASLRKDRSELECFAEMLGRLHGHGVEIDWEAVFAGRDVRRVELPTYAFVRERYWLPVEATRPPSPQVEAGGHPLLGRAFRMSAPADAVFFERSLAAGELAWLSDHRIGSACPFPAAGLVELGLAAARELAGADAWVVERLRLDRALLLRAEEAPTIQVVLREEQVSAGTSAWRMNVSEAIGDGWQPCCRALVSGAVVGVQASGPSLDELRRLCSSPVTAAEFYASTQRLGYPYGPAFRGVEQVWRSDDGATVLGRVSLPSAAGSVRPFVVHPALLDACFTLTLATRVGASARAIAPVQIDRVAVVRPLGAGPIWCSATVQPLAAAGRTSADLRLYDERGAVIGWVEGFITEPLDRAAGVIGADDDPLAHAVLEPVWRELQVVSRAAGQPGRWLIVAGQSEQQLADRVREQLEARGARVSVRLDVDPLDRAEVDRALDVALSEPLDGIVSLWAPGDPMFGRRGWAGALHLTQSSIGRRLRRLPRLVLVTHRANGPAGRAPTRPEQCPTWGIGASIRSEHPELRPLRIDLGELDDELELAALAELALSDTLEDQVALRGPTRHVARLVHATVPRPPAANDDPLAPTVSLARRLLIDRPGSLDDLRLDLVPRREPGPGEVEIAVEAAGINFRDVLLATGVVPPIGGDGVALGFECAGTITAVGPKPDGSLAVGDRVVALTFDGLATHVVAQAQLVLPMPEGLSWTEAASLPQVQITAYYALHHVARLRAGERVLIHSATGGVGLAALQWARAVGAEIYATAGSEEKREWLRAQGIEFVGDSRSTSFADDVLRWTRGEGVDVVLNALSGELMRRSLALVRPGGRFVELGLRDAIAHTQLDLAPFARGISYTLINLGELIVHAPGRVRELFMEVLEHVRTGVLAPLPRREAPLSSAAQLMWEMGRGRHIGKFVVRVEDADRSALTQRRRAPVSADASYLITGGLGGLGLALARGLAERGAGELILVGRRGVSSEEQRAAVEEIEATGARVRVAAIDVADREAVAKLVATLAPERPLRGIVHAAAVLEDAMLINQSIDGFERVMSPKVAGAWNLHEVSAGLDLDFFVLYGSIAAILGAPGQANYVAANAFLAGLARHRRALGLPASCLSWGPFADVGLAAAHESRGARLGGRGLQEFSIEEGVELFSRLRASDRIELLPCRFDVGLWAEFYPEAASWPYLAELTSTASASESASEFLEDLRGRPELVVRRLLVDLVVRELARVTRANPAKIDPATPFAELGVDSLLGIELRNRLRATTRVELSATAIWTHPTPAELAAELFAVISKREGEAESAPAAVAVDDEVQATLELDVDTATNELLAELDELEGSLEVRSHV